MRSQVVTYKFKATLTKNDKRTGYQEGAIFSPKGFYYNKKQVILVGDIHSGHTIRLSFPVDSVSIEITNVW